MKLIRSILSKSIATLAHALRRNIPAIKLSRLKTNDPIIAITLLS